MVCEFFVLTFGLWTVACNLTMLLGGGLQDLLLGFVLLSLALGWGRWWYNTHLPHEPSGRETNHASDPHHSFHTALLWGLVIVAMAVTLVAHRPDPDDATYVNRAVTAADNPQAPLLQYDGKHSIPVPIRQINRGLSFELLAAALSWLTQLPAIYWLHLVFPALAAMLVVLAYAELFRLLAPTHWIWGVLAVMVFLCVNGEVHRTYGNFSFVRLHHGKAMLVSVLVPLLIAYSLRFVFQPTRRHWLLLSSAQITAIGLSSTGFLVAPVVVICSLLTGVWELPAFTERVKRFLLGCTAAGYPIALGLSLRLPVITKTVTRQAADIQAGGALPASGLALLDKSVQLMFGDGRFVFVNVLIVLTAWLWCETRLARRLCLIFPLGVGLLFANPLSAPLIAHSLSISGIYWRVFWLLPLPMMAGLTLIGSLVAKWPLALPGTEGGPSLRFLVWGNRLRYGLYALVLLLVVGLSEQTIFSPANRVRLGLPGLKVTPEYQIAHFINDALDTRPNVLAPYTVSVWLPTFHGHPYPLIARELGYWRLGRQAEGRMAMQRYIIGRKRPANAPAAFRTAIQDYGIAGVCLLQTNPWITEIRQVLTATGFEKQREMLGYEIWIASPS